MNKISHISFFLLMFKKLLSLPLALQDILCLLCYICSCSFHVCLVRYSLLPKISLCIFFVWKCCANCYHVIVAFGFVFSFMLYVKVTHFVVDFSVKFWSSWTVVMFLNLALFFTSLTYSDFLTDIRLCYDWSLVFLFYT